MLILAASPLANNPSSVGFSAQRDHFRCWTIRDLQFTVSTSYKINLFLLLGDIELPSTLKPSVPLYSDHLESDFPDVRLSAEHGLPSCPQLMDK